MKARKKPVEVEVKLYDGTRESAYEIIEWVGENGEFLSFNHKEHSLYIKTLEGKMHVSNGDYVIRGVQGEHYPCKPDIFHETYEVVS